MVAATDASLLHLSVLQRGSPVRTMRLYDSDAPVAVPKRDQLLSEPCDGHGKIGDLLTEQEWLPEPAQVLSHRGAGPDPRQFFVVFGNVPVQVPTVGFREKRRLLYRHDDSLPIIFPFDAPSLRSHLTFPRTIVNLI